MNRHWMLTIALISASFAQTAPPQPPSQPSDPVVVVMEGKEWKKSELETLVRALPPPVTRNFYLNKREFLKTYALMIKLAKLAEDDNIESKEPHKSRLVYNRLLYLAQAQTEEQGLRFHVPPDEQKKYYDEHKNEYSRAHAKVLYLSFNDNPVPAAGPKANKPRTSAEAEKLAREIVAQARGGADFTALVKRYSDDAESKAKDGDYAPIKPADTSLPAPIKTAIFSLKPGQVSAPVRQSGGFWIFKLTDFIVPPYDEVKQDVFSAAREALFRQWMEGLQKSVQVEFKDESYLDLKSPAR